MNNTDYLVYILIPAYNRRETTKKCIHQLKKCGVETKYKIVLIDDGSTDGTSQAALKIMPEIVVIRGNGSLWWTGAIKKGMQYARQQGADIIFWLNDDCLVTHSILQKLVDFIILNPRSIIGAIGYESTNPSNISFGGKRKSLCGYKVISPTRKSIYACDLLSGNLVCMSAQTIDTVGYPNPERCPHYGGDSLFLIRARKLGYSLFLDARESALNISSVSTSNMNSNRWLMGETSIKELVKLMFVPTSVISWRMWWFLYIEDYSILGIPLFLYQTVKTISILLVIFFLRRLPLSVRERISLSKRRLLNQKP